MRDRWLDSAIDNLRVAEENQIAARSRILDADIAAETAAPELANDQAGADLWPSNPDDCGHNIGAKRAIWKSF